MDRRKFLTASAAGLAVAAIDPVIPMAEAAPKSRKTKAVNEDYSVVILGDTHFDTEPASVYHSYYNEPVEWLNRVQRAEFARNGEMWRERCPKLLDRAARLVTPDTKMVFQMGDLIQGDCGNPEVHKKMLDDVLNNFKAKLSGLPFVTVVGNHDIRGTGAEDAYYEYMPKRMSQELGKKFTKSTFGFMMGPDAVLALDFNKPDDAEIEKLLKETEGARYTFVITHGPLFPSDDSSCRWFFHGSEEDTEARRHFRKLFAQRDVICLCGHTHDVEFADWFGDGGRITQMTMSSVWSKEELAKFEPYSVKPSQYGTLYRLNKKDDGSEVKDESELFNEYKPGLKRYANGRSAGSFKMNVSDHGVTIDFYGGDSEEVTETFVLR